MISYMPQIFLFIHLIFGNKTIIIIFLMKWDLSSLLLLLLVEKGEEEREGQLLLLLVGVLLLE